MAKAGRFHAKTGRGQVTLQAKAGRGDVRFSRGFKQKRGMTKSGLAGGSGNSGAWPSQVWQGFQANAGHGQVRFCRGVRGVAKQTAGEAKGKQQRHSKEEQTNKCKAQLAESEWSRGPS